MPSLTNDPPRDRPTAAILVGGQGTRMGGADKPLLVVAGRTILARQLDVLRPLAAEVLVVAAADAVPRYQAAVEAALALAEAAPTEAAPTPSQQLAPTPSLAPVRVIADLRPGAGPLAGLEAALAAAARDPVLVVAGDMPALHPAALALLLSHRPDADAALPRVAGRLQPLHARYARRVLATARKHLDTDRRSLHALLAALDLAVLDEDDLRAADPTLDTVAGINTPADLARLAARLGR